MIGCFGDLTFSVSSDYVLTFDNFQYNVKGRYARHELINSVPILEFSGADTEKITLDVLLTATLGVNPTEEIARVQNLCSDGTAEYLIIANMVIGFGRWVITDVQTKSISYDGRGNPIVAQMSLTFESYAEDLPE